MYDTEISLCGASKHAGCFIWLYTRENTTDDGPLLRQRNLKDVDVDIQTPTIPGWLTLDQLGGRG
jgi:hypothetical protein